MKTNALSMAGAPRAHAASAEDRSSTPAEPVLLVLADISGYTRPLTSNAKTLAHSGTIVTQLVRTLVKEVELPLLVARQEGDVILFFARKEEGVRLWSETKHLVGGLLPRFFTVFAARLEELRCTTICTCQACANIDRLRLRVVVHCGEARFERIAEENVLGGADVAIMPHLLTNTVQAGRYLLLTEAALEELKLPRDLQLEPGSARGVGSEHLQIWAHVPSEERIQFSIQRESVDPDISARRAMVHYLKLWWNSAWPDFGSGFQHIENHSGIVARLGFALTMLLIAPILLPFGLALTTSRAWFKRFKRVTPPGGIDRA